MVRWETANLAIAYDTSLSVVEQLRSRISEYIVGNSREWNNSAIWIDKVEFQNVIHLSIALEREWERSLPRSRLLKVPVLSDRHNWQDWGGRWARGNASMKWFRGVLQELDLKYTAPIQPILLQKGNPFLDAGSPQTRSSPFRGFFRFHLCDVPRYRPCSCPFPNNAVDKPWPIFLTPLPLRWTRTVFLNAVRNKLHSVHQITQA